MKEREGCDAKDAERSKTVRYVICVGQDLTDLLGNPQMIPPVRRPSEQGHEAVHVMCSKDSTLLTDSTYPCSVWRSKGIEKCNACSKQSGALSEVTPVPVLDATLVAAETSTSS